MSTAASPRTGVVLLNYGDPADLLTCLESLEWSDDLDMRVLVVDNGPDDEAHQRLRSGVGARAEVVATGSNLGYAGGNNVGIANVLEQGCDLVWILNPDTIVFPETLRLLVADLEDVPDCGVIGPRLLYPSDPVRIFSDGGVLDVTSGATKHESSGRTERRIPARGVHDVAYVTGASMLIRRSLIEQVGPLPEHYFLYYEETEWCRRAQERGWRCMVDRGARMHHIKRSSGLLPQPYYIYYLTRNRYLFAERCLGIDGAEVLAKHDLEFVAPWRAKVERTAPSWLEIFDEVVDLAKADAVAGVEGRNDAISSYPRPREEVS